ncbi:MAG: hypothetical protein V8R80_08230 [Eubacterium sp.]
MSQQFDCSNGLPKDLCLAFIQWDPNWKQRTQEQRVTLIRTFAEYRSDTKSLRTRLTSLS